MLAFIEGQVVSKTPSGIILNNQGLGYAVFTTLRTQTQIEINQKIKLLIYEQIREDCHDLYGFLDEGSKQLFEFLRTVSGVGPKMAMSLMEIGDLADLQIAIIEGDKKFLSSASGVGQRLAERISLELKDKLKQIQTTPAGKVKTPIDDEALIALQVLGLNLNQANQALKGIDEKLTTQERIKQALRKGKIN